MHPKITASARSLPLKPIAACLLPLLGLVGSACASPLVTSCGDDPADFTTLRHAVLTANPGDTVELSGLQCSKITLTNGAIAVTVDDLKIHGPGAAALAIDGNGAARVFKHTGIGTLILSDLT